MERLGIHRAGGFRRGRLLCLLFNISNEKHIGKLFGDDQQAIPIVPLSRRPGRSPRRQAAQIGSGLLKGGKHKVQDQSQEAAKGPGRQAGMQVTCRFYLYSVVCGVRWRFGIPWGGP
jgi:hypothetical protein